MNNRRPSSDRQSGRNRKRRRPQDGHGHQRPEPAVIEQAVKKAPPPILRTYGIAFYDTPAQAREDSERLADLQKQVDQLNIVIKAEGAGTMDDPDLLRFGKVYAGEAWYLIHKRRETDGWYNEMHE